MYRDFDETLKETKAVIESGTSAIHLCGDDYSRMDEFIKNLAMELRFFDNVSIQVKGQEEITERENIVEWNYGYGQVDFFTRAKIGKPPNQEKISFPEFLDTYKNPKYALRHIIVIRNARHIMDGEMNRENLAQLQQTIVNLKMKMPGNAVLVYCDEKRFIPDELSSLVYFLEIKPPSREELADITDQFIKRKEINNKALDMIYSLSSKCVGMSEDSFKQVLNKAALDKNTFADNVMSLAEKTKKQFVDKSGLLKFVDVDVNINNVGGLGHLKWWLKQKKKAFENSEEAKAKGIRPAKGILLVGMPGCGKSLTSKAVAAFFNLPLLSLDLGSLMGKYLGESEENLRRALKLAENSSPCVLWVDEIEKAFAGVGGDESGVSQRLFGYLLTWLNDKKARVFVMATANDVAVLPPEFLRRGRFDEIFYVDFPNEPERRDIFEIYLKKAVGEEKWKEILTNEVNAKQFNELIRDKKYKEKKEDDGKIVKIVDEEEKNYPGTEGYAGSDIESLVNSANERAWKQEKDFSSDMFRILLEERKYMTPLKEVLAEKIAKNREKFGQYKLVSASETKDNLQRFETDSESEKEEDQLSCVKDERCPPHILIKLAEKGSVNVKLALLDNTNCPASCVFDLMKDSDDTVKTKANDKQSATPAGIINITRDGSLEQKLDLLKKKREIPEEALLNLVKTGDRDILEKILEHDFISKPAVMDAVISQSRNNAETRKWLNEHPKFPEEKKKVLKGQACLNCFNRKGISSSQVNCRLGFCKGDAFFWCESWDKRTSGYENYCVECQYNSGKECVFGAGYMDNCISIKTKKPNSCQNCRLYMHYCRIKNIDNCPIKSNNTFCSECVHFRGDYSKCKHNEDPDSRQKFGCPYKEIK